MSTSESSTKNMPTRGSTTGAGAAESLKGTVHHIQDMSETIRENAMDFVDTMFGTPRQQGASRAGAAKAGEGTTRGPASGERAFAGDVPRRTGDAAARTPMSTSTSTVPAGHGPGNDTQTRSSESQPATGSAPEPDRPSSLKGGGHAEDTATQGPPALPPHDAAA